jgi:hypothetical protein
VALSLTAAGVALAQEAPPAAPTSLIAKRCQAETAKLCAGIEPGGGRLAKCLRGHEAELSDACKAAVTAGWRGGRATAPAAAPAPAERPAAAHAPTPPPPPGAAGESPKAGPTGGGRPRPGMGMNAPSAWGPMAAMRRTCSAEIAKFCREVKPGHGRIAVCLNEHPQELSRPCKASVEKVMHQMGSPMEMHKACADDVIRLCGDVPPGTGRVAFCIGEHSAELAPDCKKQVAEMKDGWARRGFAPRKGMAPAPAPTPARPGAAPAAPPPPPARPGVAPSPPPPPPARAPVPPPPPAQK